ncbi:hypothetical protein KM427_12375 [Nocardioides sp. LMS-CY]|uniref:hypothetical protein n=1 Tax=Nocardioides sp. (strain LMS-CY) TaxID=2840457 RepID=UPI001C007DBC|nr:hypothetical protein [Nocardioides sp. LMS-CY]QWF24413.1 hypothetical protein KM427_12375 [Nocardioides sp. LMS-CY]
MNGDEHDEASLERALRAPGTPSELSEEERYVAMFRAARATDAAPTPAPGGARRAAIRRLGAGSTLAIVFAVASAGVAAAYSSSLPDPVQRAFHSVLAPIGVPPSDSQRQATAQEARTTPEPTPPDASAAPSPASPTTSASADPSTGPSPSSSESASPTTATDSASPSTDPSGSATPTDSASPTATDPASPTTDPTDPVPTSPTGAPTTSPSPTTTPTAQPSQPTPTVPPVAPPASVSIVSAGAGQRVAPGGTAVVAGQVRAADGTPVAGISVVLQARGSSGWHRISVARTAADGSVSMATGPLQQSTSVRLRAGGVASPAWRLVLQPTLVASAQTQGAVTSLSVSATGGRAGDSVVLLVRRDGLLVQQARGVLDAAGTARFDVPTPARLTRYVVRLPATPTHAFAQTRLAVTPGTTPSPSPSASPSPSGSASASPSP